MKKNIISLFIGFLAGVIDIIPMIIQEANVYYCLSTLVHWIFLGLIIPNLNLKIKSWLKGGLIAVFASVPIILIIVEKEPEAVLPILFSSLVLGIMTGIIGEKAVNNISEGK